MRKNILNSTLIIFGIISLFGCKKFLETLPDNRIDMTDPANVTVNNVSELLVNAYPKANYMGFCETMSDNADDKVGGSLTTANYVPYMFLDAENSHAQDMPTSYWDECYKAIALTNQALEAIGTVKNPGDFSAQKGEALVARAYAHFMLVNLFSKTYNPATAASDPGIPYVTAPETVVFGQYDRRTVAATYDAIRADLLAGLPLINDDAYTVPKYHFTKAAANAFAARFYLFKQQYDSAIIYSSKVAPSNNFASVMRPWLTTYRTITYYDLQQLYTSSSEKANLLLVETLSNWADFPYYRFGITSNLVTTIFGTNVANGSYAYRLAGTSITTNLPKFYPHFVQSGLNSNTGYYYTTIPLFTTEEALLNRAEAYTRIGNINAAIVDLNTFASQRIYNGTDAVSGAMIPYDPAKNTITADSINKFYSTGTIQTKVLQAVLDFKRAEFAFEGMRWFDMQRNNITVSHKFGGGSSTGKDTTIVVAPDDKRRVIQIPDAATLSGLQQNPRD